MFDNWTIPCKVIEFILRFTLSLQIPHLISCIEKCCVCWWDQPVEKIHSGPSQVDSSRGWEGHLYTKGKLPILTKSATLKPTRSDTQHHLRWDFTSYCRICPVRCMSIRDKLSNICTKFDQLLYMLMESRSSQVVFQAMMLFLSAALSLIEVIFEFSFPLLSSPHTSTGSFFTVLFITPHLLCRTHFCLIRSSITHTKCRWPWILS